MSRIFGTNGNIHKSLCFTLVRPRFGVNGTAAFLGAWLESGLALDAEAHGDYMPDEEEMRQYFERDEGS